MSFLKQTPAYLITEGDQSFPIVQIENETCMVAQVHYGDIVDVDVKLEMEQSIDGEHFDIVPGSVQTIDPSKASHSWNWPLPPKGLFVRVSVKNCAGKVGSINTIDFLV